MLPEVVLRLQQVDLGVGMIQQFLDAVDVIVVAVSQQDIGDDEIEFPGFCDDAIDFPGRIDHRAAPARNVFDQVNEILHRPHFQRVNLESGI